MRSSFIISLMCSLVCSQVFGQGNQLTVSEPEELTIVVRSENQAGLSIVSDVPGLEFESTRRIFNVRQINPNQWQLLVEPGRQMLTIRASGYLPVTTRMAFLQAQRVYRLRVSQIEAWGTLIINTFPSGAGLRINGVLVGDRTPYQQDVAPGTYRVEITKEGYRSVERMFIVESNRDTQLSEKLEAIKKAFYKSWWFWASSAAAVTGGAVYLSRQGGETSSEPLPAPPDLP